ncbi:MAG: ABC transporter permease [bacterium]|nr:ABC transporter permease [bacterium]
MLKKLFKKHKLAAFGAVILFILYFCAIFADFISPYRYDVQNRDKNYHPPTGIHFFDSEMKFYISPFIYGTAGEMNTETYQKKYVINYQEKYFIKLFVKGDEHLIFGIFKTNIHLFGVDEPGRIFIFGSDYLGRDIFTRILYGSRISLSIGLIGVFISFFIGMIVGGISGYFGGWIDNIIMRFCEIIMSFPHFYLLLALRATFPPNLNSVIIYILIIMAMSFIEWAGMARVVRGMVLSLREEEYVLGARAIGASPWRIIYRHILPNTMSYAIISATLSIPGYILGESALSLLSLGIMEPQASWGNMLSVAKSVNVLTNFPWVLTPGIFIFAAIMAFNFLGDGLRDIFDPKQ